MKFNYLTYTPLIIIFIIIFTSIITRNNKRFFAWIEDHWFYKQSTKSKISQLFFMIGVSLLALSLLDLRGQEQRVIGKVSDQKTIILVDSSASMLAEDVRPNRFRKALLLMKHYVKKAVGQKIAISVFSDSHKTIVPFTDDYDLIEARINMLETLELERGGTGLSLAIQESIQYFKNTQENAMGNILIFTDGEETDSGIKLEIPEGISVAVVGVGTAKGGPIPIRNSRNEFMGNKKYNGELVVTKLDEKILKKLGDQVDNYKYWVAASYSLPTEQILDFFNRTFELKQSKNDFRVRPVLFHYITVPALILLGLSYLLNFGKTFYAPLLICLSLSLYAKTLYANEVQSKEPVKSEKTLGLEAKMANGELSEQEQLILAASLLKDGFNQEAQALYEEILPSNITEQNIKDHFNYGTALLKNNYLNLALSKYNDLLNQMKDQNIDDEILDQELKKNILKALKQGAGGKGSKDKDDKEEQDKNKQAGDGESGDDKSEKEDKGESKDDKGNDKNQKPQNDQNQKKQDQEGSKKSEEEVPILLKQLVSDDNQLQKKMIDAKTTERKSSKAKDW